MTALIEETAIGRRRLTADGAFTIDHFRSWALDLELDNGKQWEVEDYFALYLEDYFAGTPENWLLVPEGNAKTTARLGSPCT